MRFTAFFAILAAIVALLMLVGLIPPYLMFWMVPATLLAICGAGFLFLIWQFCCWMFPAKEDQP